MPEVDSPGSSYLRVNDLGLYDCHFFQGGRFDSLRFTAPIPGTYVFMTSVCMIVISSRVEGLMVLSSQPPVSGTYMFITSVCVIVISFRVEGLTA